MKQSAVFCLLLIFISACNNSSTNTTTDDNANPPPPMISFSIVKVYPHDTSSYTQGLQWYNNNLYEGTGDYTHSKLLKTDLASGKILQQIKTSTDSTVFGEGITVFNNKIYELTWKTHKVYVYDINTFKKINEFDWPFEGWGLTNNGKELIVSTGSSILYFVDPENFKILRQVNVTDNNGPVSALNELEYVNGFIYANIYETDYIVKINPENGNIAGKIDCSNLLQKSGVNYNSSNYSANTGYVLNGIAYDSAKQSFYITGKMWPALFEIKLN
jgi:glutamine cyclotransferase